MKVQDPSVQGDQSYVWAWCSLVSPLALFFTGSGSRWRCRPVWPGLGTWGSWVPAYCPCLQEHRSSTSTTYLIWWGITLTVDCNILLLFFKTISFHSFSKTVRIGSKETSGDSHTTRMWCHVINAWEQKTNSSSLWLLAAVWFVRVYQRSHQSPGSCTLSWKATKPKKLLLLQCSWMQSKKWIDGGKTRGFHMSGSNFTLHLHMETFFVLYEKKWNKMLLGMRIRNTMLWFTQPSVRCLHLETKWNI